MQATSQEEVVSEKKKMVKIDPDVHEALDKLGKRGESFSDIIRRLVQLYKEHKAEE
jgi:predicted CopG family antitoxin